MTGSIDVDYLATNAQIVSAYPYVYNWKNNEKRASLYARRCRVLARGSLNSALVEFNNGQREIISRNALKREVYYE